MSEEFPKFYEFGEFRLDVSKRLVSRNGQPVSVMPKAFDLLLTLVRSHGQVVTKDDLMISVWHDAIVEENSLNVNVSALRKIFGEKPHDHRFIVTVPGIGYKFVANVHEIQSDEPSKGANLSELGDSDGLQAFFPTKLQAGHFFSRLKQRPVLVLVSTVTLLLPIILVSSFFTRENQMPVEEPEIARSIAVLPFSNESGDANLDYLSDGLSESLIDRLAQLPQIKVIARSSSFKYRGSDVDLREVANALGVEAIVIGRVVQRDDKLSVRVELIDAPENRQMWSDSYNRPSTDLQAVQSEIAQTVSEKLRLRLTGPQEQQLVKHYTANPLAHEMLLKGKFYREKQGAENSKKAIEYYNQAIALDPNYPLAYVALASTYSYLGANGLLDPNEATPKAEAAAFKALELDQNLAEAHTVMANLKQNAWQWAEAERQYRRAIELNPNLFSAHTGYGHLLTYTGRHDLAVDEAKRGRELNPIVPGVNVNLGQALYLARRYDEALEATKRTFELNPDHLIAYGYLGDIYSAKGMHGEAIAAYQKLGKPADENPPIDFIYLGAIYARAGQREKAQAYLKRALNSRQYLAPGALAVLYAALGERDQAIDALEKAYDEHDIQLIFLGVEPNFDSLRDDPRFLLLLQRVGLK